MEMLEQGLGGESGEEAGEQAGYQKDWQNKTGAPESG